MQSRGEAVRKIGADALLRTRSRWEQNTTIQDALINALDDPYLINRQFASRGLEDLLGVQLKERGYRFYMTPEERKEPIAELRQTLRAAFANPTAKSNE